MDAIDGMRVFTSVVREGSFSAAARRLGISKALASKYVAQLETRLGVRLLNRTTRSLHPTELGRAYYARSLQLLAELDELEEDTRAERASLRGLIRVAGPPVFGEDLLADSIARFMARHREIRVELMLEERMVDVVGEGFDVAVRVGELHDSSLVARRIGAHPFVLCASREYLEREGAPKAPSDLGRHDCIVDAAVAPTGQWRFLVDGRPQMVAVRARARVNSACAAVTLTRAGLGIGMLVYSRAREDLAAGRLVRLLERYEAYDRGVYALYPPGRPVPAKVQALVAHLVESFRDQAPQRPGPRSAKESRSALRRGAAG